MFCWASKYSGVKSTKSNLFTKEELRDGLIANLTGAMKQYKVKEEYGLSNGSYSRYQKLLCTQLKLKSWPAIKKNFKEKKLLFRDLKAWIEKIDKKGGGRPTLFLPDEEALFVATAEARAAASQPQTRKSLSNRIQIVLQALEKLLIKRMITSNISISWRLQAGRRWPKWWFCEVYVDPV